MSVTSMHLRSNVDLSTKSPKQPINIPNASDRRSKSGPGLPSTDLLDATADGSANMTLRMESHYNTLMHILDSQGMMPLCLGVLFVKHDILQYLYDDSQTTINGYWISRNRVWVLLKCVKIIFLGIIKGNFSFL